MPRKLRKDMIKESRMFHFRQSHLLMCRNLSEKRHALDRQKETGSGRERAESNLGEAKNNKLWETERGSKCCARREIEPCK